MEKVMFIDGNSLLNRAYYALPALNNSDGANVNAVLGFLNIMLKALDEEKPTKLVVAFDKRGKNFRKELYSGYKASRKGMPDDLAAQMPILQNLLSLMKIKFVEKAGVEADDIIGTLNKRFKLPCVIVTGDRDLLQMIDADTTVLLTKKGVSEVERLDEAGLMTTMGLKPYQIIEYKAIRGDASDNIPGVCGIGEKGAMTLLNQYGDLNGVYAHLEEIKGAVKEKLVEGKQNAYLSKELATIVTDVDVDCRAEECGLPVFDGAVKQQLLKLEFRSIIKRLNFVEDATDVKHAQTKAVLTISVTDTDGVNLLAAKAKTVQNVAIFVANEIYIAFDEEEEYKISFSDNFLCGLSFEQALKSLKPVFESEIPKTVYDGKAVNRFLSDFGIQIKNIKYDINLMQYLVEYRTIKTFEDLRAARGGEAYAATLLTLKDFYLEQLKSQDTDKLYWDVELPLSFVLADMEKEGVKIDVDVLESLSKSYKQEISVLSQEAYRLAGQEFNVLSPKQLNFILYEKLSLPRGKKNKTGYSTDNDALEKISNLHPIIEKILKIRQLSKLNGTYAEGLNALVKDGLLHTHFNQTLTTTGRLSSSDPNLQNIPVRDDIGKEIRKAFVPKYDLLISADYSQIELRLLAYFSHDQNLIDAFKNGEDIHRRVASEILGIPPQMVTSSMRRTAKAVNFGIIYGISDYGLKENIDSTVKRAREYINAYYARYPSIKAYLDGSVKEVKEKGFVTTILGRRRYIPEINSSNFALRSFGERAAKNMPLQGSAADLMKIAMVNVYNRLNKENLKSKIIIQVHDELIVDAFAEEEEKVKAILKQEMENALVTEVPFLVNVASGANMFEAK